MRGERVGMGSVIRGVIIRVEGVLVESSDAHALAWKSVLDEFGIRNSFVEVRRSIGMCDSVLIPKLSGVDKFSSRGREISKRKSEIFREFFLNQLRPIAHGRRLIEQFKALGLDIALFSSSERWEVDVMLRLARLDGVVRKVVAEENLSQSNLKESDLVSSCLEKLSLSPSEVILIGDTPYDLVSASSLGIKSVALRSGGWSDHDLKQAVALYDSPLALLENLDHSPFTPQAHESSAA